ncbi:hypothetical protein EW146_g2945 [Bondarzewia mesenterica]|uniref:Uncharacterized protein n=1 Tax=Bondarzewia mesenterica TaxID=1095465 RepID=A0A4S4M1B3_9AGAM|nr:hypothetical protein EW146_g2945 [Bondarzewia mesenterica]
MTCIIFVVAESSGSLSKPGVRSSNLFPALLSLLYQLTSVRVIVARLTMMYNYASILEYLDNSSDTPSSFPSMKPRLPSMLCLPSGLPSTSFLQREAEQMAPKSVLKQLRRSPTPPSPGAIEDALSSPIVDPRPIALRSPTVSSPKLRLSKDANTNTVWQEPQPYEVLRAVERKDIAYLMEVRDRAFHLLVRRSGGVTPLLHAMRIGASHREVAIILVGAFSRFINHLEDEEMGLSRTKVILKALRANLKLAIDFGLQSSQSDLIASFLQTLVMSEGEKWVFAQVSNVGLALRAGTQGQPVCTAQSAVRSFATKELGKAQAIATLEDYVANATGDLLMMAVWRLALESITGDSIPSWYFARDDRVYKAFCDLLDKHQVAVQRSLPRRLKWQIRVLRKVLEGRNTTWPSKVKVLAEELDTGEGV